MKRKYRPKIRGGREISKPINRLNNTEFNCDGRDYMSCYNYLLSATYNNTAVHQLFDILNTDEKFNAVKNGQVDIQDLMEDNDIMGFFCGGSECGNYYGVGSCNGTCCGFGGLGIGCSIKFKDKRDSHY